MVFAGCEDEISQLLFIVECLFNGCEFSFGDLVDPISTVRNCLHESY